MDGPRTPNRWKPIVAILDEFQSHLASHVPKIKIQAANDRGWSELRYQEERRKGTFRQYGVYLMFGPDETLQYVGLAMNAFNDRIWSHDAYVERQWTDIIAFSHENYFLAPALEFFLICRLQPPMNSQYKSYTLP
ncbi:MAG: hypothetical protein AAGF84_01320 [Planctomycetota bacterium]